jgi:hypothetical protein
VLNAAYFLLGVAAVEIGLLSLTLAAAYWAVPGAGTAAATGVLLVAGGAVFLTKFWRRLVNSRQKSRHPDL